MPLCFSPPDEDTKICAKLLEAWESANYAKL